MDTGERSNTRAMLLAAGLGTRLRPFTGIWPKCLMPIGGVPLLEHWLTNVSAAGIDTALVNLHHQSDVVQEFLAREIFEDIVHHVYEDELLGTAGTLRKNRDFFRDRTILLAHADNWCQCDFNAFIDYHLNCRPKGCSITMMTFDSPDPSSCGIVEMDDDGIVLNMFEKQMNPPGNCANGAVYLLEPEILEFISNDTNISDFSTQVIPAFYRKIATWHNDGIHRDIGTPDALKEAQNDNPEEPYSTTSDEWTQWFSSHPIHKKIDRLVNCVS